MIFRKKIKRTDNKVTVWTTTGAGRQYEVEFRPDGEVISVSSMFRRGCDYRTQSRMIYVHRQAKPMSLAAAIAVRAALTDIDAAKSGVS